MNVPKLVTELIVIGVIAFSLYDVILPAIPTDVTESPLDITVSDSGFSADVTSEGQIKLDIPEMTITSNLPADVSDVSLELYLGSGAQKYKVGTLDIGTLKSGVANTVDPQTLDDLSAFDSFSFLSSVMSDDNLTVPVCVKVNFKYIEWEGSNLVDLGVTIKQNLDPCGSASITTSGTDLTVTATVTDNTLLDKISGYIAGSPISLSAGGASFELSASGSNITFEANGNGTDTALELVQKMLSSGEPMTITVNGTPYTVTAEDAQMFIDALSALYPEGGA